MNEVNLLIYRLTVNEVKDFCYKQKFRILKTIIIFFILSLVFLFWGKLSIENFTTFIENLLTDKNKATIYITFFIVSTFASIVFIPVSWIKITGGLLLDFWPGLLLSWFAVNIGGIVIFSTCRTFGKELLIKLLRRKLKNENSINNILSDIDNKGLPLVINLRILPILPAAIINILCGLSTISLKNFILGSLIGTLPGTIIAVYISSTLTTETSNPYVFILLIFILVTFNVANYIYRKSGYKFSFHTTK